MTDEENRPVSDEAISQEFGGSGDQISTQGAAASAPPATETKGQMVAESLETLISRVTDDYLEITHGGAAPGLARVRDSLLDSMNRAIGHENQTRVGTSNPRLTPLTTLPEDVVARVLLAKFRIVRIDLTEGKADDLTPLAIYVPSGPSAGIYDRDESRVRSLIRELKPSAGSRGVDSIQSSLWEAAPRVSRTTDARLIPVANGVYDHERHTLEPFSPDWVFLSKMQAEYDSTATNPTIVMPDGIEWDVDSWIDSLSDDEGVPALIWEVIGATTRSTHRWNKSVFLESPTGNNGKGTLLQLLRNLVGPKACASIKFADFGKDFVTAPLIDARVNLVDENGVGKYAESIEDWKSFTTGDVVSVNRKFKNPVAFRWTGFEVQCFNSRTPKTKDNSGSFYRRLLILPFNKSFEGRERPYIKSDYLAREDVLRYVLRRALESTHVKLSNPAVCQQALDDYMGNNNGLLAFWREFEPRFQWELLPFGFLHDLYKAWFRKVNPSGQPQSQASLTAFLADHLATSELWEHRGDKAIRPARRLQGHEPLINEFDLRDWMNPHYTGSDPVKRAAVPLKTNYKGILRVSGLIARTGDEEEPEAA